MIRCLSLAKSHVLGTLSAAANDALERFQEQAGSVIRPDGPSVSDRVATATATATSLLHVRFRSVALKLRPLIAQIESRIDRDPSCRLLGKDCYDGYFQTRKRLLDPLIRLHLDAATARQEPLVALVRAVCLRLV